MTWRSIRVKYTVNHLSSSSITTRWPTTWVTTSAVRVPHPWYPGVLATAIWLTASIHKTGIDAFIFHSHCVTKHISPVIRIVRIMYGGGQNIQPPPPFPSFPFDILSLSSPLSAAVHSFRPHAVTSHICSMRWQHICVELESNIHHQTAPQQIYPNFYPQGLRAADQIFSLCFPLSLSLFCFLLSFIKTGCSHALVNRFSLARSFFVFHWA